MRWLCLLVLAWAGTAAAADVEYLRDIKPLLKEKCSTCHGALEQEAGLRLDAGSLIRRGSDGGPVIEPGSASDSLMIRRVSASDASERMPPAEAGSPLTAQQIALLSAWINSGAVVPEDEPIPVDPSRHWAFRLPQRPPLPEITQRELPSANPIDAFIAREHRRLGLQVADPADRYTLLRRVYLDLIGLPPTRAQTQAFIEDNSPDAWLDVVNQLLESPQYGERWGRHWMDVWRYSDWDGYKQELRGSQRHIWRWRDWIVQSLCEDKGYDQMIVEMLAGDEVAPGDPAVLAATGYLARNYHKSNRNIWLDATVEHTAKAFLGLTINCSRCHDHKYDPIPQQEYYQFRAIFEPHQVRTDRVPGQADLMKDGLPRAFDADLAAETYLFLQGNDKHPDKDHPLAPAVPAAIGGSLDIQPVSLPVDAYYPALREFVVEEQLTAARKELADAGKALADAQSQSQELESQKAESQETPSDDSSEMLTLELQRTVARLRLESLEARLAADRAKYLDDAAGSQDGQRAELAQQALAAERQLALRQAELTCQQKKAALQAAEAAEQPDAKKKQAAVDKARKELAAAEKALQAATEAADKPEGNYSPLGQEHPRNSSGRRLALARWIASPDNPLTARVAVNHIWMRHFGEPLVENVFDFGLRSPRPRHADLLDWLAVELMENDWSMKHLHHLIVTSQTWQLASSAPAAAVANRSIDRDNHCFWRANVRRLHAEVIRDSVLSVAGQLDASMGGADIDFRQGEASRRRSIYLRHAYEKQMKMLVLFDAASPNECYRRSESIIPQQALALANSSLSLGQSRLLARQLWQEVSAEGGDVDEAQREFVRAAFLQVLCRPPASEELAACQEFLAEQAATLADTERLTTFAGGEAPQVAPSKDPQLRSLENLVHVLMNHNDFVTVR